MPGNPRGRAGEGGSCAVVLAAARWLVLPALLALSACGGGVPHEPGWASGGPLKAPPPHAAFMEHMPGAVFTDGLERLRIEGTQDAVLDHVEFVIRKGDEDSMEHLGTLVTGQQRTAPAIQVSDGFPPDNPDFGPLVEAKGAVIEAGGLDGLLLIGIRRVGDEYAIREGLNVYYTVDGKRFVTYFPYTIVFCPSNITDDQCSDRWEAEDENWD